MYLIVLANQLGLWSDGPSVGEDCGFNPAHWMLTWGAGSGDRRICARSSLLSLEVSLIPNHYLQSCPSECQCPGSKCLLHCLWWPLFPTVNQSAFPSLVICSPPGSLIHHLSHHPPHDSHSKSDLQFSIHFLKWPCQCCYTSLFVHSCDSSWRCFLVCSEKTVSDSGLGAVNTKVHGRDPGSQNHVV